MRLIDADELLTDNTWEWFDEWGNRTPAGKAIMDAPTIDAKTKCVARIELDTEEVVKRIKEEYDITDGWIPCSERLPSERGWYLITVQDVNRFTDVDYYYGNSEWDEVSSKQEVIAWMPLPKPYKAESEKKHEG